MRVHRIQVDKNEDPLVSVGLDWDGPAFLVGEGGENILAVGERSGLKRAVVVFFDATPRDEFARSLVEAAAEHDNWEAADVHVFEVFRRVPGSEGKVGDRIGMMAVPVGTELEIQVLPESGRLMEPGTGRWVPSEGARESG